jgi:signal transduction histidine kinase
MFFNSLSGRILVLTLVFVAIAEVLIFVPSVARFRVDNLQSRLELAQLAALAQLATPDQQEVAPALERQLLKTADIFNVVLRRQDVRELALSGAMPQMPSATYNLLEATDVELMRDAVAVFLTPGDRVIRVIGRAELGDRGEIEITMSEGPLRQAMIAYGLRILYVSLAISLATAALLFVAVRHYVVKPISRVVRHMTAYRDAPEDSSGIIEPSNSIRELRAAETALHDLQLQLTKALRQKDRLAALGGAVAKISHDLRNLLTTAQLLVDRIEASADPAVRRTAPKLVASLDRAISLCERTLTYGKAEEPAPVLADVALAPLLREVAENESLATEGRVPVTISAGTGIAVRADADQLFRVLTNLVRNAVQAIESSEKPGAVCIRAARVGDRVEIRVVDTGPGLPPKAQENLFQPFSGGARRGGAGLGLVIASELAKGHGGTLDLESTGPEGATFLLTWPAPLRPR